MCNFDKELLYSYVDETIGELEKIFVEEHLKYCTRCQNELREIRDFDKKLEELNYDDIVIPNRLFIISEQVVENCISKIENEQVSIQYSNYKEGLKVMLGIAKEGYRQIYDNPYGKKVGEKLNKYSNLIKKQAKKVCRKKLSKTRVVNTKLMKTLKVV
ncbi:zf-HC2 domain-containing protein [Clostridium sp. SM-530-WT-3G]|uniref:anti-sigma factor family protein n=1 Tax=Clostridium sp. SM-530-WT-3G TaxID=2725303 RepID=UPI00145D8AC5|nr:zf-HC2 domain-containing protein [Clostridium sp. SM-530-WT-3G]NME82520.1 zf-HC2 domain-containing protein [Clostridium sp. SM-530-WT-3G]